jgi:hypothetical protein
MVRRRGGCAMNVVFRVLDVLRPMWEGRESDGNMSIDSLARITQPTLLIYESNSAYLVRIAS